MQPSNEQQDEARLVHEVQTGSPEQASATFEDLVMRNGSRLFLHLSHRGVTCQELEDLANETWARACRLIGKYEYRGISFFAWLQAIADRVALEHFRTLKRRYVETSLEDDDQDIEGPGDNDPEPVTLHP